MQPSNDDTLWPYLYTHPSDVPSPIAPIFSASVDPSMVSHSNIDHSQGDHMAMLQSPSEYMVPALSITYVPPFAPYPEPTTIAPNPVPTPAQAAYPDVILPAPVPGSASISVSAPISVAALVSPTNTPAVPLAVVSTTTQAPLMAETTEEVVGPKKPKNAFMIFRLFYTSRAKAVHKRASGWDPECKKSFDMTKSTSAAASCWHWLKKHHEERSEELKLWEDLARQDLEKYYAEKAEYKQAVEDGRHKVAHVPQKKRKGVLVQGSAAEEGGDMPPTKRRRQIRGQPKQRRRTRRQQRSPSTYGFTSGSSSSASTSRSSSSALTSGSTSASASTSHFSAMGTISMPSTPPAFGNAIYARQHFGFQAPAELPFLGLYGSTPFVPHFPQPSQMAQSDQVAHHQQGWSLPSILEPTDPLLEALAQASMVNYPRMDLEVDSVTETMIAEQDRWLWTPNLPQIQAEDAYATQSQHEPLNGIAPGAQAASISEPDISLQSQFDIVGIDHFYMPDTMGGYDDNSIDFGFSLCEGGEAGMGPQADPGYDVQDAPHDA